MKFYVKDTCYLTLVQRLLIKVRTAFIILYVNLILIGCINPTEFIFGKHTTATVTLSLDKPAGRYDAIPSTIDITFPDTVDITSVSQSDFSISETCSGANPTISGVTTAGQIATVSISGESGCANTETVTITIKFTKIAMVDTKTTASGTQNFIYTVDTSPPTLTATINSISGISSSASYSFTSMPTSVVYTFSSDIDLSSVVDTDFIVATAGGTDCSTLPTVGTLITNSSTHTVTVPLTGTCNDGESFLLTLSADSVSDSTLDSTSGASAPLTAPAADLDLNISVFTSTGSVISVGDSTTSADGSYGIGGTTSIIVQFDQTVDVTGTPRLQLNITGGATRYADYSSGTGTNELTFDYLIVAGDTTSDLDYSSTTALQLNGGTISRSGSSGDIATDLTLPSPGAANSLGFFRNIVIDTDTPTISSSSPSGPTDAWGTESRDITFTFSKTIDAATIDNTDLTISSGTCMSAPTVLNSALSGVSNEIITFSLSTNSCADGETYDLSLDPSAVKDLSGNDGTGAPQTISVTTQTDKPTIMLSAPSSNFLRAADSLNYTVTYSGATSVTLADGDINFAGASADCLATVSGSGLVNRTISITGCSSDGAVQISIAASTAINAYGNLADSVDESLITDFTSDNTELPDPTLALPIIGLNSIYALDSENNFTLTFSGDDLAPTELIEAALSLNCDSGGGANPVSFTAVRSSSTIASITPDEGSPDFIYNANCTSSGASVPDSAGNLHNFAGIPFKVGNSLQTVSGPSGSISLATVTATGDLGLVIFNVPTDPATIITANISLTCNSQDITISSLNTSVNDTNILIDFDETDTDWTSLIGGESCTLTFNTSVLNSLGMPIPSPTDFNFTTTP
ncbi:MAG: hypothetical protein ABL927_03425 [Bdellovibrionales bacterium]